MSDSVQVCSYLVFCHAMYVILFSNSSRFTWLDLLCGAKRNQRILSSLVSFFRLSLTCDTDGSAALGGEYSIDRARGRAGTIGELSLMSQDRTLKPDA